MTDINKRIDDAFDKARWGDFQKPNGKWANGISNRDELKSEILQLIREARIGELNRLFLHSDVKVQDAIEKDQYYINRINGLKES